MSTGNGHDALTALENSVSDRLAEMNERVETVEAHVPKLSQLEGAVTRLVGVVHQNHGLTKNVRGAVNQLEHKIEVRFNDVDDRLNAVLAKLEQLVELMQPTAVL